MNSNDPRRMERNQRALAPLTAAALVIGVGGSVWLATGSATADGPANRTGDAVAGIDYARDLSQAFKQVARDMAPSVVSITAVDTVRMARPGQVNPRGFRPPFDDDLFRRFFGLPDDRSARPRREQPREFQRQAQGTGVIVRADGYIATNNHIVENADDLMVTLEDGREFEAEVVGTDPDSDLAVLRIDASGLPKAPLGESEMLEVGEWVLAMGNPFGLEHTVTAGIVSATGRAGIGLATFENFIQTDAAINPGNSGGPLVNLEGEVVGINTAITTRSGGSQGIGFAIPSRMVRTVVESIIETGEVRRGWLGVNIQPLTEELADQFGYRDTRGVLLAGVMRDGPAEEAGIEPGDIVVRVGETRIENNNDLLNAVASYAPGEDVEVEVFRRGDLRTVTVELGQRPSQEELIAGRRPGPGAEAPESGVDLGLRIEPLTPELRERLDLWRIDGVVVTGVEPGGPAGRANLQPGDVITGINRTPVESVDDYKQALAGADLHDGLLLQIYSRGVSRFVLIRNRN